MESTATYFFLLMFGAAALLLWGVRMVRSAVERAYGAQVRRILSAGVQSRLAAAGSGALAAASLQSSTAVALLTASFVRTGAVTVGVGLALMLGADVGSAVVASILTLDVKRFWPVFVFSGYLLHATYEQRGTRGNQSGRILFGIGLILLALSTMGALSASLAGSEVVQDVLTAFANEPLLAVLLVALITWLAHSSIAILLFVASLAAIGIITEPTLLVAMVLGINIGGAIPAIILTWTEPADARRITIGNGLFKLLGGIAGLVALPWLVELYHRLPGAADFRTVVMHILLNMLLASFFLWFLRPIEKFLRRTITAQDASDEFGPMYIASHSSEIGPSLALSSLVRETLRMLDIVEVMLRQTFEMLLSNDRSRKSEVHKLDDQLDMLYEAIKSYATDLTRRDLKEAESRRAVDILSYATSLENAGDIVDKSLLDIAEKKIMSNTSFSEAGIEEIRRLYYYVVQSNRLADAVTMNWKAEEAQDLLHRKREFKGLVGKSSEQHLGRLRRGEVRSLETSSYHLDIIGDLQRINSLLSGISYAVIGEAERKREGDSGQIASALQTSTPTRRTEE